GTDTQPPVLTIPEGTTVTVGTTFDPLEGVSAVDNTDGDVTDRIEVTGGVDTTSPGQYALTYVVSDTNGNQAIGSRAVTVREPSTEPSDPDDPSGPDGSEDSGTAGSGTDDSGTDGSGSEDSGTAGSGTDDSGSEGSGSGGSDSSDPAPGTG